MGLFQGQKSERRLSEEPKALDVCCSKKEVVFPSLQPFSWNECVKQQQQNAQSFLMCIMCIMEDKEKLTLPTE